VGEALARDEKAVADAVLLSDGRRDDDSVVEAALEEGAASGLDLVDFLGPVTCSARSWPVLPDEVCAPPE
jgi:hypothetical protein